MLVREQSRRREDRDLLAVLDRLERRPDRDLGLAEADVAAHEPIHRVRALHVALQVVDRGALVGRLDEREGILHLLLPRCVLGECMTFGGDPLLVEHDELLCDLADRRADLALRLREVAAAEAMQRRGLAADVLAEGVDLVGRHVELVAALVGDEQVVAFDAADRALDHALVLADAVLVVDDVVARAEIFERRGALALAGSGLAVRPAPAGEIGFGDDGDLGVRDRAAPVQRRDDDVAAGLADVGGLTGDRELEPLVEEDLAETCRRAGAVRGDRDREAVGEHLGESIGEAGSVAPDRAPPRRLDERRVG